MNLNHTTHYTTCICPKKSPQYVALRFSPNNMMLYKLWCGEKKEEAQTVFIEESAKKVLANNYELEISKSTTINILLTSISGTLSNKYDQYKNIHFKIYVFNL
jgi:hypothetical protein